MPVEDPIEIKKLLDEARVIAVVGHSDKPHRTSYSIGRYLRNAGYKVYAVNPTIDSVNGEPAYPNLAAVPEPIDIVDVFRRSEYLDKVVDEAIAVKAKAVWSQLGVIDDAAAKKAEAAGLKMVMDRCIKVDHAALIR
ncbi:MAG: CoA-binding protein [Anaerolineales bacterium]